MLYPEGSPQAQLIRVAHTLFGGAAVCAAIGGNLNHTHEASCELHSVAPPSWNEAVAVFGKIGVVSFGGPAGQIALMHRILVDEKKWLDERTYLSALNFCMLLPGPEAMQLATYSGWRLYGVKGGLMAGLLFVLPGALVILALSMLYAAFGKVPAVEALFTGIKAAVLAIVIEALLRVAKRALKQNSDWWIAGAAFAAIFAFGVPFPMIVLSAAIFGFLRGGPQGATQAASDASRPVPLNTTLGTILAWLLIWITPLAALALWSDPDHVFTQLSWFFSKLSVVTFGGAYAVLAYMAQDVVVHYMWLQPGEMLDGLGLAETTPGPLILVNQFVGYLSGYRAVGHEGWTGGLIGAAIALWATFAPCFLWIFAGAPYIERLNSNPRLAGALAGVTAAVVGVILNLSVWFALHVLFHQHQQIMLGPLDLSLPVMSSLNMVTSVLALIAVLLLFVLHRSVLMVIAMCAALGMAASQFPF